MAHKHHVLSHASKQHQFCLKFEEECQTFCQSQPKKVAQPGTDGDSGAGMTLHHHALDICGWHEMVHTHFILSCASKQHQFCPKFAAEHLILEKYTPYDSL
jgi:hypothetical protein